MLVLDYNQLKNGKYIFVRSDHTIGILRKDDALNKYMLENDGEWDKIKETQCYFLNGVCDALTYKFVFMYHKKCSPEKELDKLMKDMSNKDIEFRTERYTSLHHYNFSLLGKAYEEIKKRIAHALCHPIEIAFINRKGHVENFNIIGLYRYRSSVKSYKQWRKNIKFVIEPITDIRKTKKPDFTKMSKNELHYNLEFNSSITRKERKLIKKLIKKYKE